METRDKSSGGEENNHGLKRTELNVRWVSVRSCCHCHFEFQTEGGCPNCGNSEVFSIRESDRQVPQTNALVDPFLRRINSKDIKAVYLHKDSPNPRYEISFNFEGQSREEAEACQYVTLGLEIVPEAEGLNEKFIAKISSLQWKDITGVHDLASTVDSDLKLYFGFKGVDEVRGMHYANTDSRIIKFSSFENFSDILAVFHEDGHVAINKMETEKEVKMQDVARLMAQMPFLPKEVKNIEDFASWYEETYGKPLKIEPEQMKMTMEQAQEIVIANEELAWNLGEEKIQNLYVNAPSRLKQTVMKIYSRDKEKSLATYYCMRKSRQ